MEPKKSKIAVKCANDKCNHIRDFNPNYSAFLMCPQCGSQEVLFDRPVIRVCGACGVTEHLPAASVVKAYHRTGHPNCTFFEQGDGTAVQYAEESGTDLKDFDYAKTMAAAIEDFAGAKPTKTDKVDAGGSVEDPDADAEAADSVDATDAEQPQTIVEGSGAEADNVAAEPVTPAQAPDAEATDDKPVRRRRNKPEGGD